MDIENKDLNEEEVKPSEDEVKPNEEEVKPSEDEVKPNEEEVKLSEDEDVITIGEEETPPAVEDSSVIKKLRGLVKDKNAENRDLRNKLSASGTDKSVELGAKPTLESCEYDQVKFSTNLEAWFDKKTSATLQREKLEAEQKQKEEVWQSKLDDYGEKKSALKVPDYEEAEDSVVESFSKLQQSLIIDGADNSARVIYAIGKRPELLKELAAISEPVKFVARIAKLESQMKVTKRRPATQPEEVVKGSGVPAANKDAQLEKLRAEADKTNDFTKLIAYKKKLRDDKKNKGGH